MTDWAPKRFWKDATVEAVGEGGFEVLLDGRSVSTPLKRKLMLPTAPMAQAVAAEWMAQGDKIDPRTMPVTRSANAAIDKVADQHAEVADLVADYGDADLLCYRAEAPDALVHRQAEAWDPMLDWARDHLGVSLRPTVGVVHRPQPAEQMVRLRAIIHGLEPFRLTAMHDLVAMSGSLVLGLAATSGAESPDRLWKVSRIDEDWQAEHWGEDEEASRVAEIKRQAFLHALRFFSLTESP